MCCEQCLAQLCATRTAIRRARASCRGPLLAAPIRNLSLEHAAARIVVASPNAGAGCPIGPLPLSRTAEHVASCSRRELEVACDFCDDLGNYSCGQAVRLHQLAAHWVEGHGQRVESAKVIGQHTMTAEIGVWFWTLSDVLTAGGMQVSHIKNVVLTPILPPGADDSESAAAAAAPDSDEGCVYVPKIATIDGQVRVGMRSLGTDTAPAGLELRGIQLTIGEEETARLSFPLGRPLQPHESLTDNSLLLGRGAPVALFLPETLGKALTGPHVGAEKPWGLRIVVELHFGPAAAAAASGAAAAGAAAGPSNAGAAGAAGPATPQP